MIIAEVNLGMSLTYCPHRLLLLVVRSLRILRSMTSMHRFSCFLTAKRDICVLTEYEPGTSYNYARGVTSYSPGHAGVLGNERAYILAKEVCALLLLSPLPHPTIKCARSQSYFMTGR
jgi:hypothetical protein